MIIAAIYLLIILFFIYKNGLFGIFIDKSISPTQFTLLFIFKCLAIPAFYYIYKIYYGGIENYDAGNFLRDSKIINDIFYESPFEYIKLMFGFENDAENTELFSKFISRTNNWDEGMSWRLFFNDNRSLLRIHSLIHFISFNSYYVHALTSCLLGYIGIGLIYRSLKQYFISKEIWLLGVFIFLPNLWLFSGALLKEPLVLLNVGLIFFFTDRLFDQKYFLLRKLTYLLLVMFIIYYLKPQVTFTIFSLYLSFKLVEVLVRKHKTLWYLGSVIVMVVLVNFSFLIFKDMSMLSFINKKQTEFYDVAKGGMFLKDSSKFVRVAYNKDLVKETSEKVFKIKLGVPYDYWEDSHQTDTLHCASNTDTVTNYNLIYEIVPGRSGYAISNIQTTIGAVGTIFQSIFKALGFPYKFGGLMNTVVSLEGLFLTLCLMLSIVGAFFVRDRNILFFLILSSVFLLVLFGIATPNLGAIVRYRCIIAPFIVLSVLYCVNHYEARGVRKKS
ncbi:MAG: hypothetical protein IPG08_06215 [Sphingobacteriaceae bacterium]|nr:hypothetical protein [Sphingobacteriaceae bacterium]